MRVYKNPSIIISDIDAEYSACINPLIKDWLKIITATQKNVLQLLDIHNDLEELIKLTGFTEEEIKWFISIFEQKNFINYTWEFTSPKKNTDIQNMDLWIHTTDKCNLRCSYCYICTKDTQKNMEDSTIENLSKSIIETVKKYSLKTVVLRLSWWEPTLVINKRLEKIELLKDALNNENCVLKITFLSNGTTIDDNKIDIIKKNKFWLSISLDGIWDFHDKNRFYVDWKWSFEDVSKNIEKLIQNWIKPTIMTVVSNDNIDWLPELTRFLIKNNLYFRYSFVQWQDLNQEKLIHIMNECYDILEKAIENWYEFLRYHRLCDLKFLNPSTKTCSSWYSWWAIYLDWWVHFCQLKLSEEKNTWNINEDSDIIDMISKWNDNWGKLSEDCGNCDYQTVCTWWCPIERKEWKDPHCNVYKNVIPRIYSLIWKEKLFKIKKIMDV